MLKEEEDNVCGLLRLACLPLFRGSYEWTGDDRGAGVVPVRPRSEPLPYSAVHTPGYTVCPRDVGFDFCFSFLCGLLLLSCGWIFLTQWCACFDIFGTKGGTF